MLGYDAYYIGGALLGSALGVYLLSLLLRYAFLGRAGTGRQHALVVLLAGAVAIGFSAFMRGSNGFLNRLAESPEAAQTVLYSLSSLTIAAVVWITFKNHNGADKLTGVSKGRLLTLAISLPAVTIGVSNLFVSHIYEPDALTFASRGASKEDVRQIILKERLINGLGFAEIAA